MKLSMLKILLERPELTEQGRTIISGVLLSADGQESLTEEQAEQVRSVLEAELEISEKLEEGYAAIESQLDTALGALQSEEEES